MTMLLWLSVVVMKMARSPHVGIWATRKDDESVEVGEKLASLCFESINKVHEYHKYNVLMATPIDCRPCALCSCAQVQSSMPVEIVNILAYSRHSSGQCRRSWEMQHARGVCALESSSSVCYVWIISWSLGLVPYYRLQYSQLRTPLLFCNKLWSCAIVSYTLIHH